MKKCYTLAIWMNNYQEDLTEQINRVYESLLLVNNIDYLRVNYLAASSIDAAKDFILNKENIETLIIRNLNKRNNDLGSRFSFFNSKNNSTSGVSILTGVRKEMFFNTMIININEIDYSAIDSAEQIIHLFEELIQINKPYYACLTSENKMIGLDDLMKPKSVCWLNYWDKSILYNVKMNEAFSNVSVNEKRNGVMVKFEDLSMNDPLQKQVNKLVLNCL